MGRSSSPVLFIDPADNRLTSLGKQQAGRGGEGEGGRRETKEGGCGRIHLWKEAEQSHGREEDVLGLDQKGETGGHPHTPARDSFTSDFR